MEIFPLSVQYLDQAIELCNKVFPQDAAGDNPPELGFRESLFKEEYRWAWEKYCIARVEYYILLSELGNVIGTTGIYQNTIEPESAWVGWFCIDPQKRGKGYGQKLLTYTIEKAKEHRYKYLKLYTDVNESPEAQQLYKKFGFEFEKTSDDHTDASTQIIFLKKVL